ncbi:uncharacterized protein LOC128735687 [Sabethes cyaneus]|uniref:uncharacterized protein LOC128735687 n=1 Tax=Sabethes cyaneus TaxID=53552 RepID=UPI00237DB2B9|nr:uncharacterized protein LOC128735687 [Sabethes cyaneus]
MAGVSLMYTHIGQLTDGSNIYFDSRRDRGFPEPELPAVDSRSDGSTVSSAVDDATVEPSMGTIMQAAPVDSGEGIFIYIIPAVLHLGGYVIAVYIYRFADNEHLQCLIERKANANMGEPGTHLLLRLAPMEEQLALAIKNSFSPSLSSFRHYPLIFLQVFILSSAPRRLVATLWVYFALGMLWLAGATAYTCLLVEEQSEAIIRLKWMGDLNPTERDYISGFLCVTMFFHDLVQTVIIISYSITCYLLRYYLQGLKEKLLLHTIEPLNWMREICEFRKLLHHLNRKISVPVCCLTLLNLSYAFSSVVHVFRDINACPVKIISFTTANLLLWILISLTPFIQAASLTVSCRRTQTCGHLISIRPFVHRNTSSEDLNTVLLYASSLQISAELFRIPISAHYLCFFVFVCAVGILTFGMCLTWGNV